MAYLEYSPTESLFQYTTPEGLFGILQSKCLRLSDLRAANDLRELDLGYEKIIHALTMILHGEPPGPKAALLSNLVERLDKYFETGQVFCACFSLAVDDLPMWAAYGQHYSGLAIGFRPSAIRDIPARLQKVHYLNRSIEESEFKQIALSIANQVEDYGRSKNTETWIAAATDAITIATALKDKIWAYEKEIRLIFSQRRERPTGTASRIPIGLVRKNIPVYWKKPLERMAGSRTISYLEFPFGRHRDGKFDASRSIQTIIVGPHCALSVTDVKGLLKVHGFQDCAVQKSHCPIRP